MPLAIIRPDDWNLPLFLHVLGAMAVMGTLLVVATSLLGTWRREDADAAALRRLGFWTVISGVLPSFLVMRIGAQWVAAAESLDEQGEAAWIAIGYITTDLGGLLTLVSLVLAAIGLRRASNRGLARAVGVMAVVVLLAYLVAIWAMTVKPS